MVGLGQAIEPHEGTPPLKITALPVETLLEIIDAIASTTTGPGDPNDRDPPSAHSISMTPK